MSSAECVGPARRNLYLTACMQIHIIYDEPSHKTTMSPFVAVKGVRPISRSLREQIILSFGHAEAFLDQELISHRCSSFHILLVVATIFKKAIGSVVSNRIGMKFGGIVLQYAPID